MGEDAKSLGACPLCGGLLAEKDVEKVLRGGDHTAALRVGDGVSMRLSHPCRHPFRSASKLYRMWANGDCHEKGLLHACPTHIKQRRSDFFRIHYSL